MMNSSISFLLKKYLPIHAQHFIRERGKEGVRWAYLAKMVSHEIGWFVHNGQELNPKVWLFILGVNNSGTTLLADILGMYPDVKTMPREGQFMTRALHGHLLRGELDRIWTRGTETLRLTERSDPKIAQRVKYDWASFYGSCDGMLLEKSPPHMLRARWLQHYFQPAKFIVITRHPFAVCEGMTRRIGVTIEQAAQHYKRAYEIFLEDAAYLESMHTVSYEELTTDPSLCLEELGRYLDLDLGSLVVDVKQSMFKVHNAMGKPQPLKNMNFASIRRLSDADKQSIIQTMMPLWDSLGYAEDPSEVIGSDARKPLTSG